MIKFRVWLVDEWWTAWDALDETIVWFDGNELKACEGAAVCQFSGMNDSCGKEIYEGDILHGPDYPYMDADDGVRGYVATVERFDTCFCTVLHCVNPRKSGISHGVGEIMEEDATAEIQVIGNIYENPELLKWKSDD